jgi:hypothetical protein
VGATPFASELESITESVHEEHREQLDELEAEWEEIATSIESWNERAQDVWRAIADDLRDAAPDPDDHDWPEAREPDEDDDPLFDSTHDYVEQMGRYKQYQGKSTTHSASTAAAATPRGRRMFALIQTADALRLRELCRQFHRFGAHQRGAASRWRSASPARHLT